MREILFAIIGILAGWIIAAWYYRKNTADLKALEKSLPENLLKILIENSDRQMSFEELKKLINKKIYDLESDDPLPYNICPNCGNENLKCSSGEDQNGGSVYVIQCDECGWSEWTE